MLIVCNLPRLDLVCEGALHETYAPVCNDQPYRKDFDCCKSKATARQTVCCSALFSFYRVQCVQYELNNAVVLKGAECNQL